MPGSEAPERALLGIAPADDPAGYVLVRIVIEPEFGLRAEYRKCDTVYLPGDGPS